MNKELLKAAQAKIPNVAVLVNAVSRRVKQLIAGDRPYVKPTKEDDFDTIALREIAEGKITVEIDFSDAVSEPKA